MSYVIAAYGVTVVTLVVYALLLEARRRALERELRPPGGGPQDPTRA